jgi:hypothetical protein
VDPSLLDQLASVPERLDAVEARVERVGTTLEKFRREVRNELGSVRAEMDDGLSPVRAEMPEGFSAVGATHDGLGAVRAEMQREFAATREELRAEMREGDEDTRRYMRVLHEEVIERVKTIQEGMNGSTPRSRRRHRSSTVMRSPMLSRAPQAPDAGSRRRLRAALGFRELSRARSCVDDTFKVRRSQTWRWGRRPRQSTVATALSRRLRQIGPEKWQIRLAEAATRQRSEIAGIEVN